MTLPRLAQGHPPLKEIIEAQDRLIAYARNEAPKQTGEDIELMVRELSLVRMQALTLESVLHSIIKRIEAEKPKEGRANP